MSDYHDFFRRATRDHHSPHGHPPHPYQTRLATSNTLPQLLNVPTGLGKTAVQ